ncbi:ABC transporter permease [Caloramator proteoclasticus]|uniref:Spermidine/putrescine transport system permease protein n=1 Tax=Caloramator proteoclasticus DSM 10124 TaxID=1121262 RepID=A0A1M5A4R1_9CLOT|nr:ABC transporter permease [Caloramator proteoclasticus]SHF24842.1 spermidine/putrescine transport system permease protein [Caloramator proteoclasticus DSM 10124]
MKRKNYAYPYLFWMTIFAVLPLFLVLLYSLTFKNGLKSGITFSNFVRFFEPIYLEVLLRSINLALISTIICLLLGYPIAYIISKANIKHRNTLILLFLIPMWMNFLLRTYAWMTLLEKNGILNKFLTSIGLGPLNIMYTNSAVVLGMVYNFLPFMVLPIYTVLIKIDRSLIEAANDLGANKIITFIKVTLPLSLPGVISGITMVFMPSVTTFAISRLLGGGQFTLIGNLIEQQFINVGDWNFGSAISIVMMVIILISMGIMNRFDKDKEGVNLW